MLIATCDTGFDIFNGLGEVTNAYVTVENLGPGGLTHVQVTLNASDEGQPHPDKSYTIENLPAGYEMSLKLTVDTQSGQETKIQALVTTQEGIQAAAYKDSCKARFPDHSTIDALGPLFTLKKIGP